MKNLNLLKYYMFRKYINMIDARNFGNLFEIQNNKWFTIPLSTTLTERDSSRNLVKFEKKELINIYKEMEIFDNQESERGWYRERYKTEFKNKKILDLGCGSGKDGLFFARHGARITFSDLIKSNLDLVEKVSNYLEIEADFYHIKSFDDYSKIGEFDYIWAQGSLHHNPIHITKKIINKLKLNFKKNQRFLLLSYPNERWANDGYPLYRDWGKYTDGAGTPWAQPFEEKEIKYLFPQSKILLNKKWNYANGVNNFIFFDLTCN